ncbi:MAG: YcxB family protein [Rhodothermales bacterium]|nr:YcxB family protein [Rhodothermales bacterium]
MGTITATYKWVVDELLTAQRYDFRHKVRRPFRIAGYILAAFVLLAGVGIIWKDGFALTPALMILFGLYVFFLRHVEAKFFAKRKFKKLPARNKEITWTFSEDRLDYSSQDLSEGKMNWDAITKVVIAPTGLLLCPQDEIFYWLPNKAFKSESDRELLLDLVCRKNIQKHSIT